MVKVKPYGSAGSKMYGLPTSDSSRARLLLAAACLLPQFILVIIFCSSSAHLLVTLSSSGTLTTPITLRRNPDIPHAVTSDETSSSGDSSLLDIENVRLRLSFQYAFDKALKHLAIHGYGPTHPRVAVVVVGDSAEDLMATVESVFSHTDLNRIFSVIVVVDGMEEDSQFVRDLENIHASSIAPWYDVRPWELLEMKRSGNGADEKEDHGDAHDKKVHVLFNAQRRGVTKCRQDAVDLLTRLQKSTHKQMRLESTPGELILLLMQQGAQLSSRRWLETVTGALIVLPPILPDNFVAPGLGDIEEPQDFIPMKSANAVAFNMANGPFQRTMFDACFAQVKKDDPYLDDLHLRNGGHYGTPVWDGGALALRLETYMNLPIHHVALVHEWTANLDLSLALWLCADGMFMLDGSYRDMEVTVFHPAVGTSNKQAGSAGQELPAATEALPPPLAARFAAIWMDDVTSKKYFHDYTTAATAPYKDQVTQLEWDTYVAQARHGATFVKDLPNACRSLKWYKARHSHFWPEKTTRKLASTRDIVLVHDSRP